MVRGSVRGIPFMKIERRMGISFMSAGARCFVKAFASQCFACTRPCRYYRRKKVNETISNTQMYSTFRWNVCVKQTTLRCTYLISICTYLQTNLRESLNTSRDSLKLSVMLHCCGDNKSSNNWLYLNAHSSLSSVGPHCWLKVAHTKILCETVANPCKNLSSKFILYSWYCIYCIGLLHKVYWLQFYMAVLELYITLCVWPWYGLLILRRYTFRLCLGLIQIFPKWELRVA